MAALAQRLGLPSPGAALSAVLAIDAATSAELCRRWGTPPPSPPPQSLLPTIAAAAVVPVETSGFWSAIRRGLGLSRTAPTIALGADGGTDPTQLLRNQYLI